MAGALLILSFILTRFKLTPLGIVSWFLLFLGLTQLSLLAGALVAGWLLALGLRSRGGAKSVGLFNLGQIGLVLWTVVALNFIYQGLKRGLLDAPAMRVTGNGSSDYLLIWFQDRVSEALPTAWGLTLSNAIYHYIMLAWALWLAISIIRWLIWGWKSFSKTALWKRFPPRGPLPPPGPRKPGGPKAGKKSEDADPKGEPVNQGTFLESGEQEKPTASQPVSEP
jgi:hypothetical protein